MISLILTCRVNNNPRKYNSAMTYGTFTPIPYPCILSDQSETSFNILLKTLDSYKGFNFKTAIFRIEIDSDSDCEKFKLFNIVKDTILNKISASFFDIKDHRPSSKQEWLSFINEVDGNIADDLVLLSMNHDHLMVDENKQLLFNTIEKVNSSKFDCMIAYSHIPEAVSFGMRGLERKEYTKNYLEPFGLVKVSPSKWIDCIYVMRMHHLKHIFSSMRHSPSYLPRFDWFGVIFSKMKLPIYVVPVKFLYHYDGYGHISGVRLNQLFSLEVLNKLNTLSSSVSNSYKEYIEIFYIYLRDSLAQSRSRGAERKDFLISRAENCFDFFLNSNLRMRYQREFNENQINSIIQQMREMFYYDFNLIYGVLNEDAIMIKKFGFFSQLNRIFRSILHFSGLSRY